MIILTELPYTCLIQTLTHLNAGDQIQVITPGSSVAPYSSPPEIFPQTNLCMFAVIIVMAHVVQQVACSSPCSLQPALLFNWVQVTPRTHSFIVPPTLQPLVLHSSS